MIQAITTPSPVNSRVRIADSPHAMAAWRSAQDYLRGAAYRPAFERYKPLVEQFPNIPILQAELGAAAAGELEFEIADAAFDRAVELGRGDAQLLLFVGLQRYNLRQMDKAIGCFKSAVAASPSFYPARQLLASCLEKTRHLDEAFMQIDTYVARNPTDAQALYFKAFLAYRKGQTNDAVAGLSELLAGPLTVPADTRGDACHLLGVIADASGEYEEALDWFNKSKAFKSQASNVAETARAYEKLAHSRKRLLEEMTPETIRRWAAEKAAPEPQHPLALLAGMPRSGTTLMEQILGAHPSVLIFDEPAPFARHLLRPLQQNNASRNLASLERLSPLERAQFAKRYFRDLLHETDANPSGKLLLDKNPSTTAWLHVWLRFFPQSKVIIALRDPRDVVLSCYFRNVPKDDFSVVSYGTLEKTVDFYAECMDVWLRLRDLGGFDWIETRYEDVVANLEGEGRRLMEFVGLPWHPSQTAYHESAATRVVHSPTYNEVRQPLYNRAVGRWKNYAEALEPLLPKLQPYLAAFGYK